MRVFILFLAFFLASCQVAPSDMVLIPEGKYTLGLQPADILPQFLSDRTSGKSSRPQQNISLPGFYLDQYETTYGDFLMFKPSAKYENGIATEPVRGVSWYEADAYCLWLGKRLPTEFEWEKAARGTDGRLFAWGDEFHRENANFGKAVSPGGRFKKDRSLLNVYDLNGNVSEWTSNWYLPYPGSTFKSESFGKNFKVIRGGAINRREHGFSKEFALLGYRHYAPPALRAWDTGFRCARSVG